MNHRHRASGRGRSNDRFPPGELPRELKEREFLLRAQLDALEGFRDIRRDDPPAHHDSRRGKPRAVFQDSFPSHTFQDNLGIEPESQPGEFAEPERRGNPHFRRFLLLCAILAGLVAWLLWSH